MICLVPSRQAVLSLSTTCSRVALHASVGTCRARDVAAQLLECMAVIGSATHRRVQAETLHVGTQRLREHGVSRHGSLHREHLPPGARAKCDAMRYGQAAAAEA